MLESLEKLREGTYFPHDEYRTVDNDYVSDVCLVTVQRFGGGSREFLICDRCADELERWANDGELVPKPPRW